MLTAKGTAVRAAHELLRASARNVPLFPTLHEVAQRHFGKDAIDRVFISFVMVDKVVLRSMSYRVGSQKDLRIVVILNDDLSPNEQADALEKELAYQRDDNFYEKGNDRAGLTSWINRIEELIAGPRCELKLDVVVIPRQKVSQGVLIESVSLAWRSIIDQLGVNWARAYEIPSHVWEEIIAGMVVRRPAGQERNAT